VENGPRPVRVWDLPTRVFHWAFGAMVAIAWLSGQFGGQPWLDWHFRFGYAVFALLLFRLLWGYAGDRYARFSSFPPSLRGALAYLREGRAWAGHTPLGAFSVYALLVATGVQVVTGLLSSDGDFTEAPWTIFVTDATVKLMSRLHRLGHWVLLALVALHLAAIAWYTARRRDTLVRAMVTGDRIGFDAEAALDDAALRLRAVVLMALAAALVAYSVTL
jgi:cytochrome b